MVFTSLDYALLLGVAWLAFRVVPARSALLVLAMASAVFYAFWSAAWLALLLACTGVGYAAARGIERSRHGRGGPSRAPLLAALFTLLGALAVFKYADFALGGVERLTGLRVPWSPLELPLAISFYVFQILGYVIDVQRGAPAEQSPLRFAVFVGFFPQLVAGPIARAGELLPQLRHRARFDPEQALSGLLLLASGLVKKTVFADNLAFYVDRVYGSPQLAGGPDVVVATLAFGAQIYFDFSGYTDIARGSGRLFGIELPENFRSPYVAASLAEFWRRWHVTLSTWLRDYLYVPLGGSRRGAARTALNLLVTMTLGGLWHGAGATFVLWGAYHGLLLVLERVLRRPRPAARPVGWGRPTSGILPTFLAVQLGWAFFRADDVAALAALGRALVHEPFAVAPTLDTLTWLPLVALAYAVHGAGAWLRGRPLPEVGWLRGPLAGPALLAAALAVLVFGADGDAFIYFQF